jgi:hypothetical protein
VRGERERQRGGVEKISGTHKLGGHETDGGGIATKRNISKSVYDIKRKAEVLICHFQ